MAVMGSGRDSMDRAVVRLAEFASREGESGAEAVRRRHEEDCAII